MPDSELLQNLVSILGGSQSDPYFETLKVIDEKYLVYIYPFDEELLIEKRVRKVCKKFECIFKRIEDYLGENHQNRHGEIIMDPKNVASRGAGMIECLGAQKPFKFLTFPSNFCMPPLMFRISPLIVLMLFLTSLMSPPNFLHFPSNFFHLLYCPLFPH